MPVWLNSAELSGLRTLIGDLASEATRDTPPVIGDRLDKLFPDAERLRNATILTGAWVGLICGPIPAAILADADKDAKIMSITAHALALAFTSHMSGGQLMEAFPPDPTNRRLLEMFVLWMTALEMESHGKVTRSLESAALDADLPDEEVDYAPAEP